MTINGLKYTLARPNSMAEIDYCRLPTEMPTKTKQFPEQMSMTAHDTKIAFDGPMLSRRWMLPLAATIVMQSANAYLFYLIPTLAPIVSTTIGQSSAFVGWLATISTIGSILFLLVGTPLIRRFGSIRSLQTGTLIGGAGALLLLAANVWTVMLCSLLMGLGYGPSSPAGSDILQRFSPRRHRNLIFSIRQAGVPLSGMFAGLVLPTVYQTGGLNLVVVTSIAIVTSAVVIVQPVRPWVDDRRSAEQSFSVIRLLSPANLLGPIRAVGSEPGLRRIGLAGACLAIGHGCWIAYLVTYLTQVQHLSLVNAGVVFACMQGSGVIGRLLLGWLADWLSGLAVLRCVAIASSATSVALVLSAASMSINELCAFAALAGVTISSWNGVQVAVVAGRAEPDNILATASGATTLLFLGFAVGPGGFALLLDATGSFEVCFAVTAAATILGAVLLIGIPPVQATPQLE